MTAPISETGNITQRNQDVPGLLEHVIADLHDLQTIVHGWDDLLKEFGPMLEAWRRTNGGTMGLARARRTMRGK